MSQRTDLAHLFRLTMPELEDRAKDSLERINTRIERATQLGRDLTEREQKLCQDDRAELASLKDAIETREQLDERHALLNDAVAEYHGRRQDGRFTPTLLVSESNLRAHAEALREGRPFGAVEVVETRTQVAVSDMGSEGGWHAGAPNQPRHLITFAGVPVTPLTGKTASVPKYTGPTGAAGAAEGSNHGEFDSVEVVNLTAARFGRWTDVSSVVNELDDLQGINAMHGWGIARDLDLLAVDAIETAASTPATPLDSLEQAVRQAILEVAAATYSDESQLVVFGTPEDVSLLTGTTPTNGQDVASVSVRFNGARIYPSVAGSAGQVTVFAPNAWRVFQTPLQSASVIDPASGANKFGSWMHSTELANQIVGSAAAVATTGS
jgi:hypothetical protein